MLNVRFVWLLMTAFVVSTWLQQRVVEPDKHGVYFPVLDGILNFLTLPFSIRVPSIISFRFLFLVKTVLGCSWNNSCRFLLVWRMFQFLRTTAVRFGKNRLYVNIMECVLDLVVLDLFLVVDCLLQAYQLFLIAHQQVSCRNLASKISSFSVLLSDGENLSWLSRFSLFEVLGYMGCYF